MTANHRLVNLWCVTIGIVILGFCVVVAVPGSLEGRLLMADLFIAALAVLWWAAYCSLPRSDGGRHRPGPPQVIIDIPAIPHT